MIDKKRKLLNFKMIHIQLADLDYICEAISQNKYMDYYVLHHFHLKILVVGLRSS